MPTYKVTIEQQGSINIIVELRARDEQHAGEQAMAMAPNLDWKEAWAARECTGYEVLSVEEQAPELSFSYTQDRASLVIDPQGLASWIAHQARTHERAYYYTRALRDLADLLGLPVATEAAVS